MTLGKRLQELRASIGATQQLMANLLGLSQAAYSLYELGKREPSMETLVQLAKKFRVSTDYLLCLTNDPTPPTPLKVDETEEELKKYQEELLSLNAELRNLPEDQIREIVAMIKAGLAVRKEINKDKKTPTIQK